MSTNSMVPYSNPAGNNQTSPAAGLTPTLGGVPGGPIGSAVGHGTLGTSAGSSVGNPFVPPTSNPALMTTTSGTGLSVPNAGSTSTNATNTLNQETDIYGQGIGTDITNLLSSIGGTNSATLQEYAASLVPQEATAKANLDASLGAGGVSANSSVAALGNANLQAQETAAIAGEDANLTQSGQNLEASILTGQEQAAEKEVSASGWDVFGQVLSGIGSDVGGIVKAAGAVGI